MILMDQMIRTGRFYEFVTEVITIRNEETEDRTMWEFWLHKVLDMTYSDFVRKAKQRTAEPETVPTSDLESIVKESMGIINGFCPS